MGNLHLAIASESMLDEYRKTLVEVLGSESHAQVLDINIMYSWDTEEELVAHCIETVLNGSVDFVVLVSRSGNGLQIMANKDEDIRAAAIPSEEYIEEAVAVNANMCEIGSAFHDPQSACNLVIAFARAIGKIR